METKIKKEKRGGRKKGGPDDAPSYLRKKLGGNTAGRHWRNENLRVRISMKEPFEENKKREGKAENFRKTSKEGYSALLLRLE